VPAEVLVRMRGLLAEQLECAIRRDFVAFTARDELLHQQVCALSGHREVWETIAVSKVHLDRVRHMSLVTSNVMRELVRDHRRIVDALAHLDRTAAVAAVREHTRATLRVAPRLLKRFPDYFTPSDAAGWAMAPATREDKAR
jgi:DNA-binding GntR family transcriptional regulator